MIQRRFLLFIIVQFVLGLVAPSHVTFNFDQKSDSLKPQSSFFLPVSSRIEGSPGRETHSQGSLYFDLEDLFEPLKLSTFQSLYIKGLGIEKTGDFETTPRGPPII